MLPNRSIAYTIGPTTARNYYLTESRWSVIDDRMEVFLKVALPLKLYSDISWFTPGVFSLCRTTTITAVFRGYGRNEHGVLKFSIFYIMT